MRILKISIIICFICALSSCSSLFIYDKSVPEESLCTLNISNEFTVVEFNGKKVKWEVNKIVNSANEATVKIPVGENTLTANYYNQKKEGNFVTNERADGLKMTFEFQSGKLYSLALKKDMGIDDGKFGTVVRLEIEEK
jgi:hypothetical protein